MAWIDLAQDCNKWWAVGKVYVNLHFPLDAVNYWTSRGIVGFSTRTSLSGVVWSGRVGRSVKCCCTGKSKFTFVPRCMGARGGAVG